MSTCRPPTWAPLTSRRAASARGQDPLVLCLEGRRWCLGAAHLPPHPSSYPTARESLLPTWLRVLWDFCIQARHWS